MLNKNILINVLLVTVSVACIESLSIKGHKDDCPVVCPALYSPICGGNGDSFTEFGNSCIMDASNCRLKKTSLKPYVLANMAFCKTKQFANFNEIYGNIDIENSDCMKPCTMMYRPLCVANDEYRTTVSNQCVLDMFNCVLGAKGTEKAFRVLKTGKC